ncbi:MAG TPA: nicotinate-nucleotide diphosphorylase (carboxylating), partial [Solirubrobacterales bacterium]
SAGVEAGASRLLLDNMGTAELRESVALVRGADDPSELEASGGITLENVAEVASTGVDYVSVGALTHSAPALDLSMALGR